MPPAGSSWVLAEYAYMFGCCDKGNPSSWADNVRSTKRDKSWNRQLSQASAGRRSCLYHCCSRGQQSLREGQPVFASPEERKLPLLNQCMLERFRRPLNNIANAKIPARSAIEVDSIMAAAAIPHTGSRPRYTFVPAAAGAAAGQMPFYGVTPIQLIHGGGGSKMRAKFESIPTLSVPVANVVDWLETHFTEHDVILLKTDIEGGEFAVMNAMMRRGSMKLVDLVVWECHGWAGDCIKLEQDARTANPKIVFAKEHDTAASQGYDSSSEPSRRVPIEPRLGAAAVKRAEARGQCRPVAAYNGE